MESFTFLVLTYNHAELVTENLDSIKSVVEKYGNDRKISILVADDCSKDSTVEVVKGWFSSNGQLFDKLELIIQEKNVGTIRNFYNAVKNVKTKEFLSIAGDDKYNCKDIFSFYEGLSDGITITPCTLFGEDSELKGRLKRNYYFVKHLKSTKMIKKMMKYDNLFMAPGVFLNAKYYRDPILWKRLLKFKLIEDYPSWRYFLDEKGLECFVEDKEYVAYRLGSGVSTKIDKESIFYKDNKKMIKKYKI